ncbi:1,4-alpha-glucan branching protein GlgB [Candidatus Sulfurimonas marisnigri]|uniref:1,4-alpha-glucan branching enzyme GlgB n=1 Tax=Candidatus Sulfurimonas marisnigri TaxID=2740405 RepID=A0A7S7RQS2_9BACT|nr:1,4-alpha-glucan branching protein GlgB [Candidatus Sulfurimonas marisnigri]QOY54853.1 1,4-alpha-glucan branching protein GlgB [Candidatus Sulfurimonas marisnigri]
MTYPIYYDISRFSTLDIYLFKEGTHVKLYERLGAHMMEREGQNGTYFALWAPNANWVTVRGDFNNYDIDSHALRVRDDESGIWEGFIENVEPGTTYKYHISTDGDNANPDKADPYAFYAEVAPSSSSRVWNIDDYKWNDKEWMKSRYKKNSHKAPISIYEVHLGSWRRKVEESNRPLTYAEAATELAEYLCEMNFTHVELMPITEFPFEGSWGYQVTGYFAPTARYGTPQDFMSFVDVMHAYGIGVILDWVPSHFVTDGHGLMNFDGTCLYEHEDPRLGYHPDWKSAIFNYERNEVRAFLISSAMLWLDKYHIDGIRVDAVSSMLYLDFAREDGEWLANEHGGNENLGAIKFLRQLNTSLYGEFSDIMTFAEEATNFPMVSRPVNEGGLGFGYKWNMGWMHDSLKYMKNDPIHRQHYHNQLTFSFVYMYNENYALPLSHDEVVHLKGSLINKMPGDNNQKFANLRALFTLMIAHPGKKLLFMGGEFAQFGEWNYKQSLDWHLLENPQNKGMQTLVKSLNKLYKEEPSLHKNDVQVEGFEWIDENDYQANVISFIRKGKKKDKPIIIICNFSDKTHEGYPIGVPKKGVYKEIFNSQSAEFDGWNITNENPIKTIAKEHHGRKHMLHVTLPPLGVIYLKVIDK